MSLRTITVTVPDAPEGAHYMAPLGIETPHDCVLSCSATGGRIARTVAAEGLNLAAALLVADGGPLTLTYVVGAPAGCAYPADAFRPRATPHTTPADALATHARTLVAGAASETEAVQRLVDEAAGLFTYGHPDTRFTDGHRDVPLVACGGVEGSCVDINTYLVAMLRAAGLRAGYLFGYFFPAERGGSARDMHCWVVTEADGHFQEWDIAHHLKAGLAPVRPALDPKSGLRVALGHSMGHRYFVDGAFVEAKLLCEPARLSDGRLEPVEDLAIETVPPPPVVAEGLTTAA